jgi:hypothetical protein
MSLTIPEGQEQALKEVVTLPPEKWESLIATLRAAEPSLDLDTLVRGLDPSIPAASVLGVLAGLYLTRDRDGASLDDFVAEIREVIQSNERLGQPAVGWDRFLENMKTVLSLTTLGVAAKALDVLTEHPNTYWSARVLTDVRAIFTSTVDSPPETALIVHTLKIRYFQAPSPREFFVAMDTDDVTKLIKVLQRALEKEKGLKAMMERAGIRSLPSAES